MKVPLADSRVFPFLFTRFGLVRFALARLDIGYLSGTSLIEKQLNNEKALFCYLSSQEEIPAAFVFHHNNSTSQKP